MGVTMDGTKQQRRGNTAQRIQDVALEPFAEQDYGKTSLRGIAERLDVTKTALYDNFRTKEEIIVSLFEDVTQPVRDLIEWGRDQPHTLDAKQEFVRRYSVALAGAEPLFRFMQSQATVRELRIDDTSKDRMRDLRGHLHRPGGSASSTRSAASAPGHATRGDVRDAGPGRQLSRATTARSDGRSVQCRSPSRVTFSTSPTPPVRAADRVRQDTEPTGLLSWRVES